MLPYCETKAGEGLLLGGGARPAVEILVDCALIRGGALGVVATRLAEGRPAGAVVVVGGEVDGVGAAAEAEGQQEDDGDNLLSHVVVVFGIG